jgi:transposase
VKVHILCGVKTNVVTAIAILDKNAGDCPQLPGLVNATAANFTVKEVSLDKAYLSRDNLELIAGLGAMPFIPFKSNSVAGEAGSLWEKMFHFFQFQREQFLAHYHKRSNVESTFSMVKAKFGDHIRSKSEAAMVNEVLCKFLCHNICCVIAAHCELGIEATFWEKEPKDSPDVLPLVRPDG